VSHTIFWQYDVKPEALDEFERSYGPYGTWVQLFSNGTGYLGSELHRDVATSRRYIVIDRWQSAADFAAFRAQFNAEYAALDRTCAALSERELPLATCEQLES
jgi:heme-degrading monooxygenase HmoA